VDYEELRKNIERTIEAHKTIGCKYITVSGLPKAKLSDEKELNEYLDIVREIGKESRKAGITLLYHNHDREFQLKYEGKSIMEYILDKAVELYAEPDLGWMLIGGGNPGDFLEKYQNRCPVIHLKDFYAEDIDKIGNVSDLGAAKGDDLHSYFEFRPVGYGIARTPELFKKILKCLKR
jgi:sugar phosphate isomerase/epimerase